MHIFESKLQLDCQTAGIQITYPLNSSKKQLIIQDYQLIIR